MIKNNDLSPNLKKEIAQLTSKYSVALVGYDKFDKPVPNYIASGTFVKYNNIYGVITAKHVWEQFKRKVAKVSFCFSGKEHYTWELVAHINFYSTQDKDADICFLQLTNRILGTIKATAIFYPLSSENYSNELELEKRMCISVGFPLSVQQPEIGKLQLLKYSTHIVNHKILNDNIDEIELAVDFYSQPDSFPKDFGGMSGGGVWSISLFKNEKEYFIKKNYKDFLLVGVNYYQKIENGFPRSILACGPHCIYAGLLNEMIIIDS